MLAPTMRTLGLVAEGVGGDGVRDGDILLLSCRT